MGKTLSGIGVIVGAVLVAMLIIAALCANVVTRYDPVAQDLESMLLLPSRQHSFGTDKMGRDIQARVFFGLRENLRVSSGAALISMAAGAFFGIGGALLEKFAGGGGRVINSAVILFARFLSAGPGIIIALVAATIGSEIMSVAAGIAFVLLPGFIRVFGGAAPCAGKNDAAGIICMVLAQFSLSMALATMVYAAFGYFGIGAKPPMPELGAMIYENQIYVSKFFYMTVFPGVALAVSALSFHILGENLNASLLARKNG